MDSLGLDDESEVILQNAVLNYEEGNDKRALDDVFLSDEPASRSGRRRKNSQSHFLESEQILSETPAKLAAELVKAVRNGSIEELRSLMEKERDIQVSEFINEPVCGSSALMYACFYGSKPEILEYLLDNGANIEAKNLSNQCTELGCGEDELFCCRTLAPKGSLSLQHIPQQ